MISKKKILITGASGFIGKNFVEQLHNEYQIDFPTSKQLDLLNVRKVKEYLEKNKFHTILHCATHNATKVSSKDISLVFKNNFCMFHNLARCNYLYKRMLYFGSGAEYDTRNYIPKMKEEYFDTFVPVDDYGFSKYIMAKYIKNISNIIDLRLFGVYGKYEDFRIRFISQSICRALNNENIIINKNVYFDYLFIDDLVKITKILINKINIPYQYINVCSGKTVDLISLAQMVSKINNNTIKISIQEKGLKKEYSGDNKRLLQVIGKFKFIKTEDAVKKLYKWYLGLNKKKIINKYE